MRDTHLFLSGMLTLMLTFTASAAIMQVQVQQGQVRNRPSYLGKVLGTLPYGERVAPVSTQGAWTQIRLAGNQNGWIATSALTSKRIAVRGGTAAVGSRASASDVSLAGKGFSAQVERSYKQRRPALRFEDVDKMERLSVSPERLARFIREGQLNEPGRR